MDRTRDDIRHLYTTQCRLRHLKGLSARNVAIETTTPATASSSDRVGIYFTMHSDRHSAAFYTSEVLYNTTNPNWTNFNWAMHCHRLNTALPSVVFKLWESIATDKSQITEQNVVFKDLQYLGEQIPKDGNRFQPNTLTFEMAAGMYACSGAAVWKSGTAGRPSPRRNVLRHDAPVELAVHKNLVRKSYDLNTLKRVRTVQRALRQTRTAVQAIRDRVHSALAPTLKNAHMAAERRMLIVRIEQLRDELHYHRQRLSATRQQCSAMDEANRLKSLDISASIRLLRKSKDDLLESRRTLIDAREKLVKTSAQLVVRRRQLISELGFIYPIEEDPIKGGFTIGGVHLPNSEDFAGHDETMISVGLGYVCHMIVMISQFLQVPPRYPVEHGASRSKINDHFLSTIPDSDREFPLYTRGTEKMHFQYGVYLLNKTIAQFKYYCGYPTYDLRCTLANLKTLLELRPGTPKTEPSTPISMSGGGGSGSIDRGIEIGSIVSAPLLPTHKDRHRPTNEDTVSGSFASLDLDGSPSHRRPLWRPSPECCRPSAAAFSVSLDHGLDELSTTNFVSTSCCCSSTTASTTTTSAVTGNPLSSSAELRMSEPSLIGRGHRRQHVGLRQDNSEIYCNSNSALSASCVAAAAGATLPFATTNGTLNSVLEPLEHGHLYTSSENEVDEIPSVIN